jgi:hypothetical protein
LKRTESTVAVDSNTEAMKEYVSVYTDTPMMTNMEQFSMMLTDQQKKGLKLEEQMKSTIMTQKEYTQAVADSVVVAAQAFKDVGKAFGADAKTIETLTIAHATADALAGANKALASGTPPFNFIAAAGVVASGMANVASIRQAYSQKQGQTGFEGMIDEPTQFTVGEGGAAEYVSVTPMEGVNNAGSGASIVINNPIISSDFVESELPELIAEAVRKGADFGMS